MTFSFRSRRSQKEPQALTKQRNTLQILLILPTEPFVDLESSYQGGQFDSFLTSDNELAKYSILR